MVCPAEGDDSASDEWGVPHLFSICSRRVGLDSYRPSGAAEPSLLRTESTRARITQTDRSGRLPPRQ